MAMRTPTADRVRELFAFDSSTGILTRRTKASFNAEAGIVAVIAAGIGVAAVVGVVHIFGG